MLLRSATDRGNDRSQELSPFSDVNMGRISCSELKCALSLSCRSMVILIEVVHGEMEEDTLIAENGALLLSMLGIQAGCCRSHLTDVVSTSVQGPWKWVTMTTGC